MKSRNRRGAALAFVCAVGTADVGRAQDSSEPSVSSRVREMCTPDARRLCPEHPLGTSQMRYCMEAKFKQISRDCVMALEDDGLVARGTHQRHALR